MPAASLALRGTVGQQVAPVFHRWELGVKPERMLGIPVLLAVGVLWSVAALAEPDDAERRLQRADELFEGYEFAPALEEYERVLAAEGASREALVRAYAGLGLCAAALDRHSRASWAFERLLAIEAGWTAPSELSPKQLAPFREAQGFWKGRQAPRLGLELAGEPREGEDLHLTVELTGDAHGLAAQVRLRFRSGEEERTIDGPLISGRGRMRIPARQLPRGAVSVRVEAATERGTVLFELPWRSIELHAASPSDAPGGAPVRVHARLSASVMADAVSRQAGVELGPSLGLGDHLDVGAYVVGGTVVGARLAATLHGAFRPRSLQPYVQVRAGAHFPEEGLLLAAGASMGGSMDLGPGRGFAAAFGELYLGPPPFYPVGGGVMFGYQLDLLR
ncbi:MAG: hypothetical protein HYZ28_00570 [Myxococcales bacterium]|nr:hypothetical protein [Myxococcales bacterium]